MGQGIGHLNPHSANNGLLLKADFHTLFDGGYITIDEDYRNDVSRRLHEDLHSALPNGH